MKKILTKGLYIASAIFLFIVAALPAGAQSFTRSNLATGGLYTALAKDASNNIFVTRVTPGTGGATYQVVEYVGGTGTPVVIYSGLTHEFGDYPWGLTVTSTGNIFISTDFTSAAGSIIKLTKTGSSYTTSTYQTGRYFAALAVDASDNLYTTEYDVTHKTYAVVKYVANSQGGSSGTNLYDNLTSAPGYTYPTGLAVAPNGDVYVGDAFSNTATVTDGGHVYKLKASASYAVSTISTGRYATALAFDASGNLFSSENGGSGYKLMEYAAGGVAGTSVFFPMHSNGIYYPWGIAVINADNVFAIDGDDGTLGGAVMKLISNISTLSNLVPSAGALDQPFNPAITNYKVNVGSAVTSIKLTPTAPDAGETIKVNGAAVASGAASANISLSVGFNTINTVVTAPDGITTTTYTVIVNRLSNNANLSNLSYDEGGISPDFTSGTALYTGSVPNDVTSTNITATTSDPNATLTINGVAVASGLPSAGIPLVVGTTTISVVVTAQDGTTTQTYTLKINRISNNANLSALTVSKGSLTPAFLTTTTNYKDTVSNATTSIKLTPTKSNVYAAIRVNGTIVGSGFASASIPLSIATNTITIVVTAQDGVTTKTYTLKVTRLSNNAELNALSVSSGTLSPAFVSGTSNYKDTVSNTTSSVYITPVTGNPGATVKINGNAVASGVALSVPLLIATNTINVVVTAQDGVSTQTYTVKITRLSSNAGLTALTLSDGTLNPAFASNVTNYTAIVSNATTSIAITPTTGNPGATVKVNGSVVTSGSPSASVPLLVGADTISVVVTAQDGVTNQNYTVIVTRISNNATLQFMTLSAGTLNPAFATGTSNYTATVSNATASITVTPTTANPGATVTVNGSSVTSGTPSASIPLSIATNTISVVVTAQDGVTTKTYTLKVTRLSNNAYLTGLSLSSGTLSPAFLTGTTSYISSVSNATTSITVTPIAGNPGATVTVNGSPVVSGTPSASIPLLIATNTISVMVTAQDGVTTKTYTLIVTRISNNAYLTGFSISSGKMSPVFATGTTGYTASVNNFVSYVTVTATAGNPAATIKVNGADVASGSPSANLALAEGVNVINAVVTAQDGTTTRTYTVSITRLQASIVYATPQLYTLNTTITPLSPAVTSVAAPGYGAPFIIASGFSAPASIGIDAAGNVYVPDTYNNVIDKLPAGGGAMTVVATGLNHPAAVAVDAAGNLYVADNGSSSVIKIPIAGGPNITLVSTGLDLPYGIAADAAGNVFVADTYNNQVKMIPAGTTNVVLLSSGFNHPAGLAVDALDNVYVADSGNNAIKMIPAGGGTAVTVASGLNIPWAVALDGAGNLYATNLGDYTVVQIPKGTGVSAAFGGSFLFPEGVAVDGKGNVFVANTYNNNILQMTPVGGYYVNALPAGLSFSNATGTFSGTPLVTSSATYYTVTGYNADISITGSINIQVQSANLLSLAVNRGTLSPAFAPGTTDYTDVVGNSTTSMTVTPTANDPNASIVVNGTAVTSGTASSNITLSVGINTITTVVTAVDGVTTQTYTLTVTRISNNNNLTSLKLSTGTLNPAFAPATTSYTASVSNGTASVKVTPTATSPYATIKVNGVTVNSGSASASLPLAVGANTISTVVTAQDGTTTKTYTVVVTRASASLNSLYLPGDNEQTPLVSSLGEKVEANNILSPNGDGVNDIWVVKNIAFYPNNTVTVYDRQGRVVFTKKGYTNDWTGTYRGSMLNEGTYYYSVDLGNGTINKGFITVVSH